MKAFVVDRYKSKSAVRLGEMPEPEVRDDDVLVQVHAASLNQLDSKIKDGEFKLILPYRLPLILGNDVAGVVVRVGSKVRRFKPGDEVYARPHQDRIGTFAEFIAINEADVALKPKNLTMEEAASIPLVMRLLSFGIRKKAKHHGVSYSFVFMRANGEQLSKITSLIEAGIIRQVMDRIFPFEATGEALAYLETGRAKGKVVIKVS